MYRYSQRSCLRSHRATCLSIYLSIYYDQAINTQPPTAPLRPVSPMRARLCTSYIRLASKSPPPPAQKHTKSIRAYVRPFPLRIIASSASRTLDRLSGAPPPPQLGSSQPPGQGHRCSANLAAGAHPIPSVPPAPSPSLNQTSGYPFLFPDSPCQARSGRQTDQRARELAPGVCRERTRGESQHYPLKARSWSKRPRTEPNLAACKKPPPEFEIILHEEI